MAAGRADSCGNAGPTAVVRILAILIATALLVALGGLLGIPEWWEHRMERQRAEALRARGEFLAAILRTLGKASPGVSLVDIQKRVETLVAAKGNPYRRSYTVHCVRGESYVAEEPLRPVERICVGPVGGEYVFFCVSDEPLPQQILRLLPAN